VDSVKIKKYLNKKLLLMVIVISLMYTYAILDIENEEFSNVVEKVNMHSEEETNSAKAIQTVEASDERITTQIGKRELKVNSYYDAKDESNVKNRFASCIKPYE
jgi:RNase H-fold protein (predicted Holliday junction resolvase)